MQGCHLEIHWLYAKENAKLYKDYIQSILPFE